MKPFFTHINDWDGSGGGVLLCYICERLRYNSRMPNIYFKLGFVCAMCLHCIDMVIGQVGRDLTSLVEPPPPRFFWGGGGQGELIKTTMTIKGGKGENPGDKELIGICSIFMCMHVCNMDYHIKVGFF